MADVKKEPLLVFFDTEAANGSVYYGDIVEIGARCDPEIHEGSFQTLINTQQDLCAFAFGACGITKQDLSGKPFFPKALRTFLGWIDEMVSSAIRKNGLQYFPVLCAHGGFCFDFLMLLGNMERCGIPHSLLDQHNLHFADSFQLCKEVKEKGEPLLQDVRLSLDGLYLKFFPKQVFKDKHRAMGDVDAMVKVFTTTPLKRHMAKLHFSTSQERVSYYVNQASSKIQLRVLEENLSRLDACSKNMTSKRLIREGITYDRLQRIFEDCCSFMDFFEFLKERGIERKVAKFIALRFGGMGLQNQGALAKFGTECATEGKPALRCSASFNSSKGRGTNETISKNDSPFPNTSLNGSKGRGTFEETISRNGSPAPEISSNGLEESGAYKDTISKKNCTKASSASKKNALPVAPIGKATQASPANLAGKDGEDWDAEIGDESGNFQKFTLTFGKVVPISLTVEDFSSPASNHEVESSKENGYPHKHYSLSASRCSNASARKPHRDRKVLKKGRKAKAMSSTEVKQSSYRPSVDVSRGNHNDLPEKKIDTNGCLERARLEGDGCSGESCTKKHVLRPCVWFADEDNSARAALKKTQECTTMFVGDVAFRVPIDRTAPSLALVTHKQGGDHGEARGVSRDEVGLKNEAEISAPRSVARAKTNDILSGKAPCTFSHISKNTLEEPILDVVHVQNGDAVLRSTESCDELDVLPSCEGRGISGRGVTHVEGTDNPQTVTSPPPTTSDDDLSEGDSSLCPAKPQEGSIVSHLSADADRDSRRKQDFYRNDPKRSVLLECDNQMAPVSDGLLQADKEAVGFSLVENPSGDFAGEEEIGSEEDQHCRERFLHQPYPHIVLPHRGTSHYGYPPASQPPFTLVPHMLPLFMQPCLYPTRFDTTACFRGGQARAPFFAAPAVQAAVFPVPSSLYTHSDACRATHTHPVRTPHPDCHSLGGSAASDRHGNASYLVGYSSDHEADEREESPGLVHSGSPDGLSTQISHCGIRNEFCSDVEEPPGRVQSEKGTEGAVKSLHAIQSNVSTNDIKESSGGPSEFKEEPGVPSPSLCSSDSTSSPMNGCGETTKPRLIRKDRNRKASNGNKPRNGSAGPNSPSQHLEPESGKNCCLAAKAHGNEGRDVDRASKRGVIADSRARNHSKPKSSAGQGRSIARNTALKITTRNGELAGGS